jgi:hypothetical protein
LSCNFFLPFLFVRPAECFCPLVYFMGHSRAQPDLSGRKKNKKQWRKKKNWLCCRSSWRLVVAFALWNLLGVHLHTHTHAIQSVTCVCM